MVLLKDSTLNHFLIQLRQRMIVLAFKKDSDSQNNSRINFSKTSKEAQTTSNRNKEANLKVVVQLKARFGVKVRWERKEMWL